MDTHIYHTVNSGLFFWDGSSGILVDGLHLGVERGFSTMPECLLEQLKASTGLFQLTDQVLFTHFHTDHFHRGLMEMLLNRKPISAIYGPGLPENNTACELLPGEVSKILLPSGALYAKNTLHEGNYKQDPHQSFLLQLENESFFMAGDAELTYQDAEAFLPYTSGKITAGFFNVYQLLAPEGLEFIKNLPFERIFIYHLPFPEDDRFSYRRLARQVLKHPPKDIPDIELLPQMAWLDNKIPAKGAAYAVL